MPTIDLSTPHQPAAGLLDALPRRVALTLPELRLVAERAGGAPLPFDLVGPPAADPLEQRLGRGPSGDDQAAVAYLAALGGLHDPGSSLARRGLVGDQHPDGADAGLLGAVGLLATPTTAVDLDVTAGSLRARSWHRRDGDAVATLSTVDGLVFELSWLPTTQWPAELARVAVLPDDLALRASRVPAVVDLPFELADGAAEAVRSGRADLVDVLAVQHEGAVLDGDGDALAPATVSGILGALTGEAQGRLRALVADVSGETTTVVGVVSWTLLADGWHALRPRRTNGTQRVQVSAVEASELATELAPVLAEVTA